jgi:RHS repeat-associated protein
MMMERRVPAMFAALIYLLMRERQSNPLLSPRNRIQPPERLPSSMKQVALFSADGTVNPIYTGETPSPVSSISATSGVTGTGSQIDINRNKATFPTSTTTYYDKDQIGSSTLITAGNGWPVWQSTYLPYGEEYTPQIIDGEHYKFTGKERDTETGLDLMGVRYYSNAMGRFMTTDPLGGHPEDPQTLNKYSYVRNNPTTLTDPTGLDFYLQCKGNTDTCQGGHSGTTTTDANGKSSFTPTVVTSASLQDPKSGNTATVNETGVLVTTNGQTSQGIFINNTPAADINGSGKLQDFSFHIDSSDEKKGTLSAGEFKFNGDRDKTRSTLDARGAFRSIADKRIFGIKSMDEIIFHGNSTQHRFGTGPSPHLSVPDEPKNTVPTRGGFHVDRDAPGMKHLGCATLGVGCSN